MNRRSWSRSVAAVVALCALSAPMAVSPVAAGNDALGEIPDELERKAADTVSRAPDPVRRHLGARPDDPARPSPPERAVPVGAGDRSSPSSASAPPARARSARQSARAPKAGSQNGGSGDRSSGSSASSLSKASGDHSLASPTDAPDATTRSAGEQDDSVSGSPETLPFTGSKPIQLLLLAGLALLAGLGLRRVVR